MNSAGGLLAENQPARGRILRIKEGYNPNSSSIGTIVFAMPTALLWMTVAFGAVAGAISAAVMNGTLRPFGQQSNSDREAREPDKSKTDDD